MITKRFVLGIAAAACAAGWLACASGTQEPANGRSTTTVGGGSGGNGAATAGGNRGASGGTGGTGATGAVGGSGGGGNGGSGTGGGVDGSDWPMLGGNAQHTGHNAGETGTPPLASDWSVTLGSAALWPVVVEDGRVAVTADGYFASQMPVWVLDASSGATLWSHDFGNIFGTGQPAIYEGTVFVPQCDHANNTYLWAYDAVTGAQSWSSPMSAQWEDYWAPTIGGANVYSKGGQYGGLYGFVRSSGAQLFFDSSLEQYDEWSPAYDNGTVYTFVAGNLRAHNATSGAVTWTAGVTWNWAGWSMRTSPVIDAGRAFVVAPPSIHAIDLSNQQVVWSVSTPSYAGMAAVGSDVYVTADATVQALAATNGSLQWTYVAPATLVAPPVSAAGYVYVSTATSVHALDATNGTEVASVPVGGWLSIAAGRLFVAGPTGTLSAYLLTQT